ncbi:MAG: hypothetical protein PVH37_01755 [Desulfobacterales bacterium]|jgi:hypothetical protein
MPSTQQFSYYISPDETPLSQNSDLWLQPLPLSRHFSGENSAISIAHGEYFQAIRNFLENDDNEIICRALTRRLQRDVKAYDVREIHICLAKHGEFYHPARIDILSHQQKISFVLNVAVSETGIKAINKEYHCIKKLNDEFPICFLPEVFGFGDVASTGDHKIRLFLGHWFEGYKEFHLSRDLSDNRNKILVWDDIRRRYYLSLKQSAELYRQAARILTYYYNVESFEQIYPWHHGAGDFVVKIGETDLDLKLISARGYAPLFTKPNQLKNGEKDTELILQALLIFFLNLSIRMRLDRYDGVGDIVWADGPVVQSTLDGVMDGLALKPPVASMPDSLDNCFRYYLSVCTKEDLYELSNAMVATFNQRAPEVRVVKQHLKEHVEELSRVIGQVI